jgi:hypothetical protein
MTGRWAGASSTPARRRWRAFGPRHGAVSCRGNELGLYLPEYSDCKKAGCTPPWPEFRPPAAGILRSDSAESASAFPAQPPWCGTPIGSAPVGCGGVVLRGQPIRVGVLRNRPQMLRSSFEQGGNGARRARLILRVCLLSPWPSPMSVGWPWPLRRVSSARSASRRRGRVEQSRRGFPYRRREGSPGAAHMKAPIAHRGFGSTLPPHRPDSR